MASFDTSKIVSDIKSGKIKRKEPPKYIFVKHPRNNTKKKKLNPRWTAWNKNKNKRDIDEKVETYVKKNQGGQKINKDLTKDFSKNKESGVGPIREGNKYAENLKAKNKKQVNGKTNGGTNGSANGGDSNGSANGNTENKKETPKKKTNREKFNEKFIRTKDGRLARRGSVTARRAENRERARKKAQAAARKRIEEKLKIKKKKEKKS